MSLADRSRELHTETAKPVAVEPAVQQLESSVVHQLNQQNVLNKAELEFLLQFLKNADLKGHQVEMFYNLVVKIQNQYIHQK